MKKNHYFSHLILFIGIVAILSCFACGNEVGSDNNEEPWLQNNGKDKPWLQKTDGLNFRAHCRNAHCPSHGIPVYVNAGKIEYPIKDFKYQVELKCPACREDLNDTDLDAWGFSHCGFKFKGKKVDANNQFETKWQRAKENYYEIVNNDAGEAFYEYVQILYIGEDDNFPDSPKK